MQVIGLTGGICSGKSTASQLLGSLGAFVLDADKLGHEAYNIGTVCYQRLIEHFGQGIVSDDGMINRKALGSIVFSDVSQMRVLESIVWPEISRLIQDKVDAVRSSHPEKKVVIVEAAILLEAKWDDLFSKIVVVSVDRELAISRLMSRNGFNREECEKRLNSQMSNEERVARAHHTIVNAGDSDELKAKVEQLWAELLSS